MLISILVGSIPVLILPHYCGLNPFRRNHNDDGATINKNQGHDHQANSHGGEPVSQGPDLTRPESKERAYEKTNPIKTEDKWTYDFWCGVRFTDVAIAIFTIMLVIAGGFQVTVTHAIGRKQLRAYISVVAGGLNDQDPARGLRIELSPQIRNLGATPAYDVLYLARARVLKFPYPKHIEFPPITYKGTPSLTTIGKDQSNDGYTVADKIVRAGHVRRIRALDKCALYIWGVVTYRDAFGDKHFTKFSYYIRFLSTNKVQWFSLDRHNEAD